MSNSHELHIFLCEKRETICKKNQNTWQMLVDYMYMYVKSENIYVKKFKIFGKCAEITYILVPKVRIYM